MAEFLTRLGTSFQGITDKEANQDSEETLYLQSQNGNIYRSDTDGEPELAALQSYVQRDVDWMSEATGMSAIPSRADPVKARKPRL
jgi:hypothetical protein